MNKKVLLLLPALALILGGCNSKTAPGTSSSDSGSGQEVAVESVEVTPSNLELESGQSATLAANVKPVLAPNKDVTWTSSNSAVASVDAAGRVTAASKGQATITATSDADPTKSGSCLVNVTQAIFKVATSPVIDKEYRLGAYQENLAKRYFFTGNYVDQNGIRGETSEIYDNATIVKFEAGANEGEYHLKYQKGTGWKYLVLGDDHHVGESDTADAARPWKWNSTYRTVTRDITKSGKTTTYFMGCYQTNSTVSGCDVAQVANDFIFQFLTLNIAVIVGNDYVIPGFTTQLQLLLPDDVEGTPEWAIAAQGEADPDAVSIDENTGLVSATAGAQEGDQYKVTVTWGEGEDDHLDHLITVRNINYGNLENPITVDEAKEVINLVGTTDQPLFIKGTVASNTKYDFGHNNWMKVWLDGDTDATGFEGYKLKVDAENEEWSYVFEKADSLVGMEVVITGIGTKFNSTYETNGEASSKLVKVEEYQHSSTIALNHTEDFEVEQSASETFVATFEEGKHDGVIWSVEAQTGATPGKVTINQNGVLSVADDAIVGHKYKVIGTLYSDDSVSANVVVTVKAFVAPTIVASPVVGTKYKMGMAVSNATDKDADVYLTGEKSGNYGSSSTSYSAGADYELVAASEGKYHVKVTLANGSVKYMNYVYSQSGGKTYFNVSYDNAPSTEYTFAATPKTIFFTSSQDGKERYWGTYTKDESTYTTIGSASETKYITGSNASKVDVSQFPVHFYSK